MLKKKKKTKKNPPPKLPEISDVFDRSEKGNTNFFFWALTKLLSKKLTWYEGYKSTNHAEKIQINYKIILIDAFSFQRNTQHMFTSIIFCKKYEHFVTLFSWQKAGLNTSRQCERLNCDINIEITLFYNWWHHEICFCIQAIQTAQWTQTFTGST